MDTQALLDLVAIARGGSLSHAAEHRGVAVSTLARRVDALETRLGLRLLDRRADGTHLTDDGHEILLLAEPLADQIASVERKAVTLRNGARHVPVRISATEYVVSDVLAPQLPALWQRYPDLAVQLRAQAEVISLSGREADLAIRMSRPEGASLIQRKLAAVPLGFYAARGSTHDPATARLLAYDDSYGEIPERRWLAEQGWLARLALATSSTRALLTAARAGAGIALLPDAIAQREPLLVRLDLPTPPARQPWLVFHRDLRQQRDLKAARDWIVRCFNTLSKTGG